jgi:hypothetical protein
MYLSSQTSVFSYFRPRSNIIFFGLVHVFRYFIRLQKDITDPFYEIGVAIVGKEILELNDH